MSRTASTLVMATSAVAASAIFAVITLANPPAGTPGTTYGILAANDGNIGVSTTTPATKLDVNGSTTIRGWLDMNGNTIKNLAIPATSTDAASKAYVDAPGKVWGQGRYAATVRNSAGTAVAGTSPDAGECTTATLRISRSTAGAQWSGTAAVCPSNWWVCSATERDVNGATAGYGTCSSAYQPLVLFCDETGTGPVFTMRMRDGLTDTAAWVADPSSGPYLGGAIRTTGAYASQFQCSALPAWCCTNL